MSRRQRPSAFEVSFPDEAESYREMASAAASSRSSSVMGGMSSVPSKRKNGDEGATRKTTKDRPLPPVAHYIPPKELPQKETHDLFLPGEDGDPDDSDAEDGESTKSKADDKPMRVLRNFTIFDRLHQNELVSLGFLETNESIGREIVVVGYAKARVEGQEDEDEGQEDGLDEGDEEYVFLELSAVWRYEMDYGKLNDPVYILTQWAWYKLDSPAPAYAPFWEHFFARKQIAQMVVSNALKSPACTLEGFLADFLNKVDPFGHTYLAEDLDDAAPEIYEVVLGHTECDSLVRTPLIKGVLRGFLSSAQKKPRVAVTTTTHNQIPATRLIGNPDLAVMKSENQNATQVTPFIASLGMALVNETLQVVGPPLPIPDKNEVHRNKVRRYRRVKELLNKARKEDKDIRWEKADRISVGYLKRVYVEGETYNVGDVILLPNDAHPFWKSPGEYGEPLEVPHDAKLHDFFWFGLILYLDHHAGTAHIQWFEHGSGILLRELADDQQLYLTPDCYTGFPFNGFIGKVKVQWNAPNPGSDDMMSKLKPVDFDRFICNYMFDKGTGTFYDINPSELSIPKTLSPPQNCPSCLRQDQRDREIQCRMTKDAQGIENGFACFGQKYHYEDFVLFYAEEGPAHIGYITNIDVVTSGGKWSMDRSSVTVRKVGRIGDLGAILPADVVRDERHLFITNETVRVNVNELLGVVFVPTIDSLQDVMKLEEWVSLSPDHFYIKYQFPTMRPTNWNERRRLKWQKHHVCAPCWQDKLREVKGLKDFIKDKKRHPLNTLDLFGGVGAFSDSLSQGSGALKVTHAIEIMPSAAKTFKRNHPQTVVYNQCANTMLKYTIKSWKGMDVQRPYQLYDERQPVPLPPKEGDIKVITAGFPCQAHSSLNMFKDANDVKNNLVLNALSWVDAVRPIFAFFENVSGFLSHRLNASQASVYKVEGGIEMGGLKIMVRALLDMGYQVRFSLLQAAHYGTPQRRVRFFCVAAQRGHPLPELPQPSHDYVDTSLEIKLPYSVDGKQTMRPIRVKKGTTLHRTVCIDDAIGDLPRFDWKHPSGREAVRYEQGKRITAVECKKAKPHCGLSNPVPPYHHEPKTRFQVEARTKPVTNLQHFTKCLAPKRVARVIAIPMEANADYRRLEPANQEWQLANPHSYTARNGYKPGAYGRLDKNGVFATIVTNVDPTAKQSRVLNPYCKRMVTVRELARGQGFPDHFVFESHQNAITSIHRQIGNAVPYPVGRALGRELRESLFKKWKEGLQNAIAIDEDDDDEDAMDVDGARRRGR